MSESYIDEYWRCSQIRPDGSFIPAMGRLGWGKYIFSPATGLRTGPPVAPLTQLIELFSDGTKCRSVRPWVVSIQAVDFFRDAEPGPAPPSFRPVGSGELYAQGQRYSVLQASIEWYDGLYPNRRLLVDIAGGITLHVYAQQVTVNALVPEDALVYEVEQTLADAEPLPPGVSAFDSVVSTRIVPSNREAMEGTVGYNFTRQVANDGTAENVPIPPGARSVSIYQAGGPPTPIYEWGGAVGLGTTAKGTITPDANGNVIDVRTPNVPYIRIPTSGPAPVPRFYSFVFRVFP